MAELQIKTEYLPERCEICHKADCYDPKTNYCSRCSIFEYDKINRVEKVIIKKRNKGPIATAKGEIAFFPVFFCYNRISPLACCFTSLSNDQ